MATIGKELTLLEASSIIAGNGIGGGIMAVPYLVSRNGLLSSLLIILVAYFVSAMLHLMIAELALGAARAKGEGSQIVEIFRKYLFKGRWGQTLTWCFFALMMIVFLANLAAYITGAGEIIISLFGLPLWVGQLIFYMLAAGIAFFGLKVLGISEKIAVLGMVAILLVFCVFVAIQPGRPLNWTFTFDTFALALFGMVMFSFAAYFSVPQAVEGLRSRPRLILPAVLFGIGINLVFVLVLTFLALVASGQVTELAMIGLSLSIGPWAAIFGSLFTLLALITTYWSACYALVTIIRERVSIGQFPAWMIASLPTLALALLGLTSFLGFMRLAGGAAAVIVALLLVPTYQQYKKSVKAQNLMLLKGIWANSAFEWMAMAGYLLMAVGSFISI